ncbi:MAG: DUF3489 domain-containing protein [Acidobacteria bacterium]|nr:DUF3489 domain-containing protein [Acidobacteriota bacterium]
MKTFTIDDDDNITAHASKKEAAEAGTGQPFATREELAKIIETSPANRLVEIWNSLPGVAPVNKFTDRKTATTRIWKAIQNLGAGSGAQAPDVAPKGGRSARTTSRRQKAPTAPHSKKAQVIALLERAGGATLKEIMGVTEWQSHTVRGFVSGTLVKKMALKVASARREDGERVYSVAG